MTHDNWTDKESTDLLKRVLSHKCPKCVSSTIMYCPWCEEAIEPVMEGHDEFSTQWRCPKCGHRWEEW